MKAGRVGNMEIVEFERIALSDQNSWDSFNPSPTACSETAANYIHTGLTKKFFHGKSDLALGKIKKVFLSNSFMVKPCLVIGRVRILT